MAGILRAIRRARKQLRGPGDYFVAGRMVAWALVIRVAKYALPLPRLVRLVAPQSRPGPRNRLREGRLAIYARWAGRLARPRDEGSCLERSLVLYRFLTLAHAEPSLVIGFRRHEAHIGGHVWVVLDDCVVGEPEDAVTGYDVAMRFGPGGPPLAA